MKHNDLAAAVHHLCAALHREQCDPASVDITLPRDAWWALACAIERRHPGVMQYNGRAPWQDQFRYMGITFKPK